MIVVGVTIVTTRAPSTRPVVADGPTTSAPAPPTATSAPTSVPTRIVPPSTAPSPPATTVPAALPSPSAPGQDEDPSSIPSSPPPPSSPPRVPVSTLPPPPPPTTTTVVPPPTVPWPYPPEAAVVLEAVDHGRTITLPVGVVFLIELPHIAGTEWLVGELDPAVVTEDATTRPDTRPGQVWMWFTAAAPGVTPLSIAALDTDFIVHAEVRFTVEVV